MCHLLPAAQGVSIYIAAFTLMSIAIDRYFVILYPFRPRMAIKVCLTIITFVWLAAGILTFPYGWFMTIYPIDSDILYCSENWGSEESRYAFGFTTSTLQFVIPFGIISFCYIRVCLKLRERSLHRPGAPSARREEVDRERTRRTNRMLIAMVIIFGLSWLPLNIHNLIIDFYKPAETWEHTRTFFLLAHAFAMSSTCYNPFLYAWLNENFRKEFKQLLPCFVNSTARQESLNRRTMIGIDPKAGGRPARTSDEQQSPHGVPKVLQPGQSSLDYAPANNVDSPQGVDLEDSIVGIDADCNNQEMIPLKRMSRKEDEKLFMSGKEHVQHLDQLPSRRGEADEGIKNNSSVVMVIDGFDDQSNRKDGDSCKKKGKNEQQNQSAPLPPSSTKRATAAVYVPSKDSVHLRSVNTKSNSSVSKGKTLEQTV